MLTLYSDGLGGAESYPSLRFLYAYFARLIITNMQPKNGRTVEAGSLS
jgi:hypothetical protein